MRGGLLALVLLFAACSKQPAPRKTVPRESHADATVPVSPTPTPTPVVPVVLRPFRIEYREMTLIRCKGNTRVKIEDDGRVFAVEQAEDCIDRRRPFTTPYPAQPLRTLSPEEVDRLAASVAGSGLLELPDQNVNERVHDGWRQELEVELAGQPARIIAAQNLEVPAFMKVRALVLGAAR